MKKFASDLIDTARDALADRIIRTPVLPLESSKIAPYIPDDTQLFMKLELFQHTGSFKARGALLGVDWLSDAQKAKGVATFSGGNHALATAWAARKQGISAKVLMTEAADPIRIDGCRALGAEIVLVPDMGHALPLLDQIAADEGRHILHPFNDVNMAFGAATCGAEFIEDAPPLDMVVLPVGGGGLISGMAAAIKRHNPDITVIGVEPKGADSLRRSFATGTPAVLDRIDTFADSLGAPRAMPESFALARQNVDDIVLIDDNAMAETMLLMRHTLTLVAEPACTASLAATLGPLRDMIRGKSVGVLACGSNISPDRYARYTADASLPHIITYPKA